MSETIPGVRPDGVQGPYYFENSDLRQWSPGGEIELLEQPRGVNLPDTTEPAFGLAGFAAIVDATPAVRPHVAVTVSSREGIRALEKQYGIGAHLESAAAYAERMAYAKNLEQALALEGLFRRQFATLVQEAFDSPRFLPTWVDRTLAKGRAHGEAVLALATAEQDKETGYWREALRYSDPDQEDWAAWLGYFRSAPRTEDGLPYRGFSGDPANKPRRQLHIPQPAPVPAEEWYRGRPPYPAAPQASPQLATAPPAGKRHIMRWPRMFRTRTRQATAV